MEWSLKNKMEFILLPRSLPLAVLAAPAQRHSIASSRVPPPFSPVRPSGPSARPQFVGVVTAGAEPAAAYPCHVGRARSLSCPEHSKNFALHWWCSNPLRWSSRPGGPTSAPHGNPKRSLCPPQTRPRPFWGSWAASLPLSQEPSPSPSRES